MTGRRAPTCLFAASLACVAGCAPRRGDEVKSAVKVIERERTPEKLFERGKGFASVGDTTRAEQYLKAAIEAGGDETVIVPVLLNVLVDDKRYRAAVEVCEDYVRRRPGDTRMRFLLATLEQAVGDVEAARAELGRVITAEPENPEAHFALAILLRDDIKDANSADKEFRAYLRLRPTGPNAEEARGSLITRFSP